MKATLGLLGDDMWPRTIIALPEELRRSLTWDQGAEMAQHHLLKIDPGVQVYAICKVRG